MTRQEQRDQALVEANAKRMAHASIKNQIKSGDRSIFDVLRDTPPELGSCQLQKVLRSVPGLGNTRIGQMLKGCDFSGTTPMDALSREAKDDLIFRLGLRRYVGRDKYHQRKRREVTPLLSMG